MAVVVSMDGAGIAGVEAECSKVAHRVTDLVAADARRGCPVDTGALLGSIEVDNHVRFAGRVKVGTQYWDMNEYGGVLGRHTEGPYPPTVRRTGRHSTMNAQPFMRPSLFQTRELA